MFTGFTQETMEYFIRLSLDNTKSNFEANRTRYEQHVKQPLIALYEQMLPAVSSFGFTLCTRRSRCVSGAFNDARYCRENPVKTYMYLHFCLDTQREHDVPGFFFDASYGGYRYGLHLYHGSAAGMRALRSVAAGDEKPFSDIVSQLSERFVLEGEEYKKNRYTGASPALAGYFNKKSWTLVHAGPHERMFSPGLADELLTGFNDLADLFGFIEETLRTEFGQ